MDELHLWQLVSAVLGGGVALKIAQVAYAELRQFLAARSVEALHVSRSLEPLLKSADELSAKLRSLGERDFLPLRQASVEGFSNKDFASTIYLFVRFWAWVEIFREEIHDTRMGKSRAGQRLSRFFHSLESRKVRLIDRVSQRAIGEIAIANGRAINFVQFHKLYLVDETVRHWIAPLLHVLKEMEDEDVRQKVLQFAVILHALIDTLDKKHHLTRDRPGLPNKLSRNSKIALHYRVFGIYLRFVKRQEKYTGFKRPSAIVTGLKKRRRRDR